MRADVRASVGAQRGTGWRDNGLISHTQRAAHRNYGQHAVGVGRGRRHRAAVEHQLRDAPLGADGLSRL